jgi:polyhydroxyalkanoate synthesis repressor PhaR
LIGDHIIRSGSPIVIRKMDSRRLYVQELRQYVTLDDIFAIVRDGNEVVIYNAKTEEDITHAILTRIIVEHEKTSENILPIAFLRRVIQWRGDEMQALIGSYLEFSVDAFFHDKKKFLAQPSGEAFEFIKTYSLLNMELFHQMLTAFLRLTCRPPSDD